MDYVKTQKKAAAAIQKVGVAMTHSRTTSGGHNPTTGLVGAAVTTAETVYGVIGGKQPDERLLAGGLVRSGDNHILLQGTGVAPLPGDTLTVGGIIYSVIAVFGLNPSGLNLLFNVWVRK